MRWDDLTVLRYIDLIDSAAKTLFWKSIYTSHTSESMDKFEKAESEAAFARAVLLEAQLKI